MQRTIRMVVMAHQGDETVITEETARGLGITDDDTLRACLGESARWCSLSIRHANKRIEAQADRETYVRDDVLGVRKDETLLPQKRALHLIESWTGFPRAFSEAEYLDLAPNVSTFIDGTLLAHMYPSAFQNPDFFQVWRKSRLDSDPGNV